MTNNAITNGLSFAEFFANVLDGKMEPIENHFYRITKSEILSMSTERRHEVFYQLSQSINNVFMSFDAQEWLRAICLFDEVFDEMKSEFCLTTRMHDMNNAEKTKGIKRMR